MRSNKGITLTSLVIYVIGLMIIIALMSMFSGYFFKNLNEITLQENGKEQYTRLLSYLTQDVNSDNLKFVKSGTDTQNSREYLIFKFNDGTEHQYIYSNGSIYYLNVITSSSSTTKKITLCQAVSGTNVFNYSGKEVTLNVTINNENFSKTLNVDL